MKKERRQSRVSRWTGAASALMVLASTQHASAQGIRECVDPDFGNEGGEGGDGGDPGREDDDALFQLLGMDIWFGTPWDPEFFGFPEWLIPGGGPTEEPGDDEPGGGGDQPGDDAPVDPGYVGASYEGELTWDDDPECQAFKDTLFYRPDHLSVSGQTLFVTLSSKPKTAIKAILLPGSVSVPAHAAERLGLKGRWSIAAGTYVAKGRRIELRLLRVR